MPNRSPWLLRYLGCVAHAGRLGILALPWLMSPACEEAGDSPRKGSDGSSCTKTADCQSPLQCIDQVCSDSDATGSPGGDGGKGGTEESDDGTGTAGPDVGGDSTDSGAEDSEATESSSNESAATGEDSQGEGDTETDTGASNSEVCEAFVEKYDCELEAEFCCSYWDSQDCVVDDYFECMARNARCALGDLSYYTALERCISELDPCDSGGSDDGDDDDDVDRVVRASHCKR